MNNVSKVKIAVGYTLLLAVLFFSLFFVHREMENLILTDDRDVQWTDSVLALIREKDTNTIKMLRTLSEANDSMVSTSDIEQIIAQQDSVVTQQRVQHRIITHRDTVVTRSTSGPTPFGQDYQWHCRRCGVAFRFFSYYHRPRHNPKQPLPS